MSGQDLSRNLIQLRDLRGWTQAQLATRSGVPRPTIGTLESGSGNPTLSVLVKLAQALSVTLDELVAPPRSTIRHYLASELPARLSGKVSVRSLLPDPLPGAQIERMEFAREARLSGVPHTRGTREYLTCESGRLQLVAGGKSYALEPGDVLVFRGDQRHGYTNLADTITVAYSVVIPTETR